MTVIDRADTQSSEVRHTAVTPRRWAVPVSIGVTVALIDLIGAGVPSYWGDEAASVMSAQRSLPSLLQELSAVDAVHGIYYAILHVWIEAFGAGEWATRSLSVLATGVFAAGLVVLGRRWADAGTGVIAGLLVALIPRSSALAIEARGYAITEALAVWLVVLFAVLRERGASRTRWVVFGVLSGLASWFFLYLLIVPLALVATVLIPAAAARRPSPATRNRVGDMIAAATAACASALPIIVLAALQRHQVAFLARRDYLDVSGVLVTPWFAHPTVAVALWALILAGVFSGLRDRAGRSWAYAALAWLLAPAAVLIALDLLVSPTYDPRYLAVSLGAAALLAARGITGIIARVLTRTSGRRPGLVVGTAAVLCLLVLGATLPQYQRQRTAYAKDGGADFHSVADAVAQRAHLGDAVLFGDGPRPSRTARLSYRLYPESFAGLQDPQMVIAYDQRAGLWDELAPVADIAPRLHERTVWLIESRHARTESSDVAALKQHGYGLVGEQQLHRTTVYRFDKGVTHE